MEEEGHQSYYVWYKYLLV